MECDSLCIYLSTLLELRPHFSPSIIRSKGHVLGFDDILSSTRLF